MLKFPRILYFINGANPSPAEIADAVKYGANVVFRNNAFVDENSNVENCAGVAGSVPHKYKALSDGAIVIQNFIAANSGVPVIAPPPPPPPAPPAQEGWGAAPVV